MTLTSSAFEDQGDIPDQYTCNGKNVNPPISISDIPPQTQSLVLTIEDPDAPAKANYTHWLVYNISPSTVDIAEDSVPSNSTQGKNDFGRAAYGGPCPPSGKHHYVFTVYALDFKPEITKSVNKTEILQLIENHVIETAQLIGLYGKP